MFLSVLIIPFSIIFGGVQAKPRRYPPGLWIIHSHYRIDRLLRLRRFFRVFFALGIVSMQKMVRLFSQRLAEEFFVKSLDRRIFMRFTQRHSGISPVDGVDPLLPDLHRRGNRLAAAANTPSRTAHDLNELVI